MKWKEIVLTTSHEASEAGANIFFEIGAQGVVIEDPFLVGRYVQEDLWDYHDIPLEEISEDVVVIKGYLPADGDLQDRMEVFTRKIKYLQECFDDCRGEISTCEVDEEDWASSWKKYYKTSKIGSRVVVKPEWEEYIPNSGEIVVEMDPGSAFGTGTHASTIMCIRLLEDYLKPGQIVFDVGCGSGILSVAAVKLGAYFVYARDIDPAAVIAARKNGALNGITSGFEVEGGRFLDSFYGKAHLILANIVSDAIIEFSPQAYERLLPGGIFIVSGIISARMSEVREKLEADGFVLLKTEVQDDWVAMAAGKPEGRA